MEGEPKPKSRIEEIKRTDLKETRERIERINTEIEELNRQIAEAANEDEKMKAKKLLEEKTFELSMRNDQIKFMESGEADKSYEENEKAEQREKLIEEINSFGKLRDEQFAIITEAERKVRKLDEEKEQLTKQLQNFN